MLDLDRAARAIVAARDSCVLAMARIAASFVREWAWTHFGFARLDDLARERLGRSGRFVRDLASLADRIEALPALGAALTGADRGTPIGRVATLTIGRVADPFSVDAWIERARSMTIRRLRDLARNREAPIHDDAGARVRIPVPSPVAAAFDEALELFRVVSGGQATVAEFVDALVGEAAAAGSSVDVLAEGVVPEVGLAGIEAALDAAASGWTGLEPREPVPFGIAPAVETSCRPAELLARLRSWIAAEDDLDRRLGELLAAIGSAGGWAALGFSGPGHYAEQRLGIARTTAEDRAPGPRAPRPAAGQAGIRVGQSGTRSRAAAAPCSRSGLGGGRNRTSVGPPRARIDDPSASGRGPRDGA